MVGKIFRGIFVKDNVDKIYEKEVYFKISQRLPTKAGWEAHLLEAGGSSNEGGSNMPFTEICIYQVKPQKVEEFEALMLEMKSFLEKQEGLLLLRLTKRGYHIDMEQIKEGHPPLAITRIVKSVKYMLYWEFDSKESYGRAQKNLYDSYWKSIEKCLIVPHDKYLGERVF